MMDLGMKIFPLIGLVLLAQIFSSLARLLESDEARLTKKLLTGYNPEVRPYTTHEGNRTIVKLGMTLSQIISVNEKEETLATSVYMTHEWDDPRLTWNKSLFGDISIHRLLADNIWTPRVILQNSKDGEFDVSLRVETLVHSTGKVEWLPPALYKSSCYIEVELYPFDWQNCTMSFQLTSYDKTEIELGLAYGDEIYVDPNAFQPNGEWDLIQKPVRVVSYHRAGAEFQRVEFYFIMQRRPQFYVMNLIIPCILMTLISCFVFFLPAISCEKMTLSISVLLGETVFLFLIAQRLPETSLSVPLIAGYLLFTMSLVIACVIFSVIVCNIHYRSCTTHVMSDWMRVVFMDHLAPILHVERPKPEQDGGNGRKGKSFSFRKNNMECTPLQAPSEVLFDSQARRYGFRQRHVKNPSGFLEVNATESGDVDMASIPAPLTPLPPHLRSVVSGMKYIAGSIKNDQMEEQSADDWAYVALILDRLLFWIYLVVFTFGTFGFYLKTATAYYPTVDNNSTSY